MKEWQYSRERKRVSFQDSLRTCRELWRVLAKLEVGYDWTPSSWNNIPIPVVPFDVWIYLSRYTRRHWWRGNQYNIPDRIIEKFYNGEL